MCYFYIHYVCYVSVYVQILLSQYELCPKACVMQPPFSYAFRNVSLITAIFLFFTIFSSILSGSFFSKICSPNGFNITQLLYFTRLFGDLGGRALTFLPRPTFLKTINGLLTVVAVRLISLIAFFLYICPVNVIPKSDIAITVLVCLSAMQSGYFAIIVYEYVGKIVAHDFPANKCAKKVATRALNISFQVACFSACCVTVFFVYLLEWVYGTNENGGDL